MIKFTLRLTAAVALLALMTVIAEAKQPQPSAEFFRAQQLSSVVRISDLRMPDGGRAEKKQHSQCSHTLHLMRIDARGDPDAADMRSHLS